MFKSIVLLALAAIAAVLIYAASKPDTFRVERTVSIKAPPEKIFALLNDYHNWPSWSPYERLDPAMTRTYSGAASGKGSIYAWEGNSNIGKGRMEILESTTPSKLGIKLDFLKPFEAHNIADFTLEPRGDHTDVAWAMHGPLPYTAKVMHTFINMDKMVGGQFAEGPRKPQSGGGEVKHVDCAQGGRPGRSKFRLARQPPHIFVWRIS